MLKVIASNCMHYFPPHLSCDLTLPWNTLTTELQTVFLAGCIPTALLSELNFLATSEAFAN